MGRPKELPSDSKPTTIRASRKDVLLLETELGVSLSEFGRMALEGALSDELDLCPTCGQPRNSRYEKAVRIGQAIRKEKLAQKKILSSEEAAIAEAHEYQKAREAAVRSACIEEFRQDRTFHRMFPEYDIHGDLCDDLGAAINRIRDRSGYQDVMTDEVIRIYRKAVKI